MPHSKTDDALLKNLVPLNTLSDEQLGNLLSRVVVEKAKKGEYLFREGDTDHQNIYLLSGTIALLSGQKEMDLVSSGTQTARFALAHQLPRKHSAQARTTATYVRIDSRMLSDMLARSHSASYEVNDIQEPSSGDWMSLLLQSPIFQQIPPANLQRVMMRMEEVAVSAGDVIIRQGDEGDYFYLISKGECSVTRTPEAGHAPVELAKLHVGKGFGEEALISEKPRSSTVTMLTDGVLVRLNKQDFIQLVKQPLSRPVSYETASRSVEDGALWLDVRTPEEYEAGHLPGAINLPFFSLRFQASSLTMDRAYMLYGAEVGQAATAAYLLTERGAEVFVLDIGWAELSAQQGLDEQAAEPPVNNVIDFNRDAEEPGGQSRMQADAQRAEIKRLKQSLAEAKAQFDEELKQRQTEVKLLKQALAVAKDRLENGEQQVHATADLKQEIETLSKSLERAEAQAAESNALKAEHGRMQERLAATEETLEQTRKLSDEFRRQSVDLQAKLQTLQQRNETQEGQLKEEITELRLQLDAALESQRENQSQSERTVGELERVKRELAELQESSEAFRKQSADDLARLSAERFDLQCTVQQLQEQRDDDQAAEQQQIAALQQSLDEARQALDQVQAEHRQRESELQTALAEAKTAADQSVEASGSEIAQLRQTRESLQQALEENREQLTRIQAEYQQRESDLQAALDQATGAAQENSERSQAEISALQQRVDTLQQEIETQESAQQQLQQEKTELAARLQAESNRVAELGNEAQSLNERRLSLEKELDSIQRAGSDAEAQHHNAMASLRDDLEQARHSINELRQARQQLEESLQQAQAESQAAQLRLNEVTQDQEQRAAEEQSRIDAALEGLNAQLEAARRETGREQEKRVEVEALLEQEHQTAAFLQRALKTAEEAVEITEKNLTEATEKQQALEAQLAEQQQRLEQELNEKSQLFEQLQQELNAGQEAWKQASESDAAMQVAKQELASLKGELEQEITNLRAQLELEQENNETVLRQRIEENEKLQQTLAERQASDKAAEASLATLKSDRQALRDARSELEAQLAQMEETARARASELEAQLAQLAGESQARESELNAAIESSRQQIESLRAELDAANARMADSGELERITQALQQAEAENASLKREISGLREVQLEMESQLTDDTDTEIAKLRSALEAEEAKRKKAEKLAQQTDFLRRERQVQETAIEMLGEDLDALTKEKESLVQERDRLNKQLSEIRGQYTDLINENDQLHSEMSGFREQASDSSLADDLLMQMEELRIKADNYERERDEAKAESRRMRREVGELRSVIETYVEQIQDVQSFGSDEQVAALRTELDMVRRQAHDDLEQMRMQLHNAESRLTDSETRDVDDVATQQAIRQEMVSMQQALNEKDHLLRLSQNQCRSLEDSIEDRDKEVDQLKRKLELLLRKTGGLDDPSMQLGSRPVTDSRLNTASGRSPDNGLSGDTDSRKSGLGRLFRKK